MDPKLTPKPRRLIAFSGRAGSGKSLASQTLINLGWERVKFADPLKNMLRAFYKTTGLDDEQIERRIEGDLKETPDDLLNGQSPRTAMIALGHDWGRVNMHDTLWVDAWERAVRSVMAKGHNVVVDDCRYVNEVNAIHKLGGRVIMITRPQSKVLVSYHPSEQFDFEPDLSIFNNYGPEELVAAVHEAVVW